MTTAPLPACLKRYNSTNMRNSPEVENFGRIIEEYNAACSWLLSLVTDPSGNRYLIEKLFAVKRLRQL